MLKHEYLLWQLGKSVEILSEGVSSSPDLADTDVLYNVVL